MACAGSKGYAFLVKTLFEYMENDYSLEGFLECFPSYYNQQTES